MHSDEERLYLLLERYLAGQVSAGEVDAVQRWLAQDPSHAVLLEDLRLIRQVAAQRVPDSSVNAAWATTGTALARPPASKSRRWLLASLAAAATVIVVLGGWQLLWRAPAWREIATEAGHRAVVRLRDGTQVTLAPSSRLRYLGAFGKSHRDVYLDGEAYFQVARDERVPFRVRTARSVTQDLGTAFVVTAYGDQGATEVVVTEGRVALWRADTIESIQRDTPPALMLFA